MSSDGPTGVVEPRDAASVIVVRDNDGRAELYFLRRHARMKFAPGVLVFPGGAVDGTDYTVGEEGTTEPLSAAETWADRLGLEPLRAAAVVVAAVREVEEETGLRLNPEALRPWACWVTPPVMARRFRTWFFIAELPADQEPLDISGEADAVMWLTPAAALEAARDGDVDLWPPQYAACAELYDVGSVEEVFRFAAERVAARTFPQARFTADEDHLGGEEQVADLVARMTARLDG